MFNAKEENIRLFAAMSGKSRMQLPETASVSALNCIDLSSPDIQSSVSLLKQACLDTGFFYVTNHGIDNEFMEGVFLQSKRFFDLPMEEKMKLLRNEKHRGYTPVFDELLDPANQIHGDYKEGYYIGIEVSEDDPDAQKPFYGPNVWPHADILPAWRETMEKYHQKALEVAKAVSQLIARALDLKFDFFEQTEILGKPIAVLRLLCYADQVSEPAKGIFGAGAHSDYGLITLLATDDVFGLQGIYRKSWRYAGTLEQLHFQVYVAPGTVYWSRKIFCEENSCTYSSKEFDMLQLDFSWLDQIAYFVEPNHDCIVECLPTCQSEENPPMFPPIKCQDYLYNKYKDTHADLNSYQVSK